MSDASESPKGYRYAKLVTNHAVYLYHHLPISYRDVQERYQLIARSESGSYLRVIFERLPEGVRVVTAFDAVDKDHRLYWQQ